MRTRSNIEHLNLCVLPWMIGVIEVIEVIGVTGVIGVIGVTTVEWLSANVCNVHFWIFWEDLAEQTNSSRVPRLFQASPPCFVQMVTTLTPIDSIDIDAAELSHWRSRATKCLWSLPGATWDQHLRASTSYVRLFSKALQCWKTGLGTAHGCILRVPSGNVRAWTFARVPFIESGNARDFCFKCISAK